MYLSRRPAVILPNNTMFVPNFADLSVQTSTTVQNASTAANSARYVPFSPPYDTAVKSVSVWVAAGTTQNFDIGLYDTSFTRLGSLGSTGVASTTGIKTWTPSTPIAVYANTTYFVAQVASGTGVTWVSQASVSVLRAVSTEASALPLPATAAPTPATTTTNVPFFKIVFSG